MFAVNNFSTTILIFLLEEIKLEKSWQRIRESERKLIVPLFFERREYAFGRELLLEYPVQSLFMFPDIAGPYVMCKRQRKERKRETER